MYEKIKKVSAIIGSITIILSSVFGAYSFFTRKIIESERKAQSELLHNEQFDKLILSDSLKNIKFDNISDTLRLVIQKQNQLIKQQSKVNTTITNHLKLSDKIDELINFYELK